MKNIWFNSMALLSMAMMLGLAGCSPVKDIQIPHKASAPSDTVGIFLVVDGSGSMADAVKNANGQNEAKCTIANRALLSVGNHIDGYLNSGHKVVLGIVLFRNSDVFVEAKAELSSNATGFIQAWIDTYKGPSGGTPIGAAIIAAAQEMAPMNLKSRHIIIVTDGESNCGPSPESVIPSVLKKFADAGTPLGVHFVAFDTSASQFNAVKNFGATVLSASDEKQLTGNLHNILKNQILEREE